MDRSARGTPRAVAREKICDWTSAGAEEVTEDAAFLPALTVVRAAFYTSGQGQPREDAERESNRTYRCGRGSGADGCCGETARSDSRACGTLGSASSSSNQSPVSTRLLCPNGNPPDVEPGQGEHDEHQVGQAEVARISFV